MTPIVVLKERRMNREVFLLPLHVWQLRGIWGASIGFVSHQTAALKAEMFTSKRRKT